jgi:hypothetical protein
MWATGRGGREMREREATIAGGRELEGIVAVEDGQEIALLGLGPEEGL